MDDMAIMGATFVNYRMPHGILGKIQEYWMTCSRNSFLAMASIAFCGMLAAAELPVLSPEVEPFVLVRAPVVVLTHVRVIDGTGGPPVDDQNVFIEAGRVSRIEGAREVPQNAGTTMLDLHGHTVMPGIVGMHNHLYYIARPNFGPGKAAVFDAPLLVPQMMFSSPRMYLAAGVTTMRTARERRTLR